jgi:hypothetical protein
MQGPAHLFQFREYSASAFPAAFEVLGEPLHETQVAADGDPIFQNKRNCGDQLLFRRLLPRNVDLCRSSNADDYRTPLPE